MSAEQFNLSSKQTSIIGIAAFTAKGEMDRLETALNKGLDAGLTINEIKEVLLQMYAYTGFPRSLNAVNNFMQVIKDRQEKGITDQTGAAPGQLPADYNRLQTGKDNQTRIAGQVVEAKPGNFAEFLPDINLFLQEHLFADIFSRDNLSFQDREIATIAALTALGGVEGQLRSHINGGLNVGLSEQQIKGLFITFSQDVDAEAGKAALDLLDNVMMQRPR
ncbi:carboxymuconolactone decarboxylase family protein [Erwinia sp.]|uniref:carboxymuconolactone decarboxylase family protein n=1 Tax=Erwinia citreus TaxID=558 RepID=UPI003C72AD4C